jgi:soluble lytic murein transglycosylase
MRPILSDTLRAGALAALAATLVLGAARCEGQQPPAGAARPDSAATSRTTRGEAAGETESPPAAAHAQTATADRATLATRAALDLARRAAASAARAPDRRVDPRLADSARAAFDSAAALSPTVADWLRLRAAAMTADPAERQRTYAALTLPAARERVRWVEAAARERFGDRAGAAEAWTALGRTARAARARLALLDSTTPPSAPERQAIRDSLLRAALDTRNPGDAREAIALLDSAFVPLAPLAPPEELAVARAAATLGQASRAAAGFARVTTTLTADDHLAWAGALARMGRYADAAREYARVSDAAGGAGEALAGRAAYERARMLLRAGDGAGARSALDALRRAGDATSAARALYLLADLASDDGRERDALAAYDELARRYTASELEGPAAFRAATLALALDGKSAAKGAAERLDAIRGGTHDDALAAGYWAGRAWAMAGDSARARERWRETARREPRSYYAMLSARRLGQRAWAPPDGARLPDDPVAAAAAARVRALDAVELDDEAGLEREWLTRWADSSATRLLAAAAAFEESGQASPAIRLATRALDRGVPATAPLFRALYPFPYDSVIRAEAARRGVDPWFAAALIRQESNFTPTATSPVGARGLMQVMPGVGRSLAGGSRTWDPAQLWVPEVNVPLGMRHLATFLGRYPHAEYALAAYNAGESRVKRWRQRAGADDPELFVERIPYDETRDYVRIILRNAAMYEVLYPK